MQAIVNPISVPFFLYPSTFALSTFRSVCLLSDSRAQKHAHMEMLLGQPRPVAMTQSISSVIPHLEPPAEEAGTRGWRKVEVNGIIKGKECVDE